MTLVKRALTSYATWRGWAERWWRLHSRLPWRYASLAWRLYREAHHRWWTGQERPTSDAVSMPIPERPRQFVFIRPGTTDALVYYDVLVNDLYGRFVPPGPVSRVLDLGANIGLVSVYFLSRFPECRVVAVEPDPENAAMCRRNLSAFGDRARIFEAAVWVRETKVSLSAQHRGTWASSVAADADGSIEGHTVSGFLDLLGGNADIVKIDVEGAERELFAAGDTTWLDNVRVVAIEPEDAASVETFERAISGRMRIVHRYGDVIFAAHT